LLPVDGMYMMEVDRVLRPGITGYYLVFSSMKRDFTKHGAEEEQDITKNIAFLG
jgi:hypothetical protein